MNLWKLYKTWEKGSDNSMKILDKDGNAYDLRNVSNNDLWNMEVKSFYFNNGALIVMVQ